MSTETQEPPKYEWLIVAPDYADVLEKRMAVRQAHFEGLQPGLKSGFWQMGGAFLSDVPKEGEPLKIIGSAMVALAATKEEVVERLKADVYNENGVWDLSKVQIYPFKWFR